MVPCCVAIILPGRSPGPVIVDRSRCTVCDEVTVAVNGHSVEATVAIRERMRQGAAFLIEGTDEGNANLLTNGVPQRIRVSRR